MAEKTLLDAVLAANGARVAGDASARADLPPGARPFVVTCMDPRLVGVLVPALGLAHDPPPQAKFAGGIVRAGDVSGVRSVLAAALFNTATEVLLVGHTECRMGGFTASQVHAGLARLGIPADAFDGEDPAAWLGLFTSERAAVEASVAALRAARRVPRSMPVHGLLFHGDSGRLEVIVRGYDVLRGAAPASRDSLGATQSLSVAPPYGYRPGPATLGAVPPPTLGMPGPPASAPLRGAAAGPSGPLGASPGPIAFGTGPVSLGAPPPPILSGLPPPLPPPSWAPPPRPGPPPSFVAPPPPPPPSWAPPTHANPAASFPAQSFPTAPPTPAGYQNPATRSLSESESPAPPPPPASTGLPPRKRKKGGSPFDHAEETLRRLRRDEDSRPL